MQRLMRELKPDRRDPPDGVLLDDWAGSEAPRRFALVAGLSHHAQSGVALRLARSQA